MLGLTILLITILATVGGFTYYVLHEADKPDAKSGKNNNKLPAH